MLVGNAGMLGPLSPLGHVEPKVWDEVMAVNVTANAQLIRVMDPLLRGRRGRPRGVRHLRRGFQRQGLLGALCGFQGRARTAGAHLCGRDRDHATVRVNLLNPGADPHAHARRRHAGRRSDEPEDRRQVAEKIVELCLPSFTETGKLYDYAVRTAVVVPPAGMTATS